MNKMVIFITGNDTDIGKTLVASLIVGSISKSKPFKKIAVIKPTESGAPSFRDSDLDVVKKNNTGLRNIDFFNIYSFKDPISPYTASIIEKKPVRYSVLLKKIKEIINNYEIVIIEGAGGLMVPITKSKKVIDLIKDLDSDCYLVVKPNLGTINHTLLSIEQIKINKINFKGIIINKYPKNPGISEIYNPVYFNNCGIKIIGVVPDVKMNNISKLSKIPETFFSKELGGFFSKKSFINECNKLFKKLTK